MALYPVHRHVTAIMSTAKAETGWFSQSGPAMPNHARALLTAP